MISAAKKNPELAQASNRILVGTSIQEMFKQTEISGLMVKSQAT